MDKATVDKEAITHLDLYERIVILEQEVKNMREDNKGVLAAFQAASGAFTALEWIAKITKPMIYVVGLIGASYMWFKGFKL